MEMDMNRHAVAGEHAAHVTESGLVVPVVTRAGREPGGTAQSEGADAYLRRQPAAHARHQDLVRQGP